VVKEADMEPEIKIQKHGAKCVGHTEHGENACHAPKNVSASWDIYSIVIEGCHHFAQWHVAQATCPKRLPICCPPPFGKATSQEEFKFDSARLQPIPPPADGAPTQDKLSGASVQRIDYQQTLQKLLLQQPAIPATGRYA
jgi:hypothetical protein